MLFFHTTNQRAGFTLVEILIACAIISTTIFAIMSAAEKGIQVSQNALKQTQSNLLLEEGAEAVRSIRDANWTTIANLSINSLYYLSFNTVTNVWSLGLTPTTPIDGIFTQTVSIAQVLRDGADDITTSGGTVDARTKKVTITVSWPSSDGSTVSSTLPFYIADIFN